jgi:hypothetical protein
MTVVSRKPKRKGYPWKCNFCGSKLMFYSILVFTTELEQQILKQSGVTEPSALFKVQKCDNKDCGRTYIFIETNRVVALKETKETEGRK